jgi:proteasome accessory factor A
LHVIAGDANLSEWAIALRAGTTNLVAALIESGWENPVPLRDPVKAIKAISRDESYGWVIEGERGSVSAIDVQRAYLQGAREMNLAGSEWILDEWEEILSALERDPMEAHDRVDWIAKKSLLDQFIESEGLDWKEDREFLQSLDLAYHNVDPELGLFAELVDSGAMRTLVTDEEIEAARTTAPKNTRAALRGAIAVKFGHQIHSLSWGAVEGRDAGGKFRAALPEEGDFPALVARVQNATTLREAVDASE